MKSLPAIVSSVLVLLTIGCSSSGGDSTQQVQNDAQQRSVFDWLTTTQTELETEAWACISSNGQITSYLFRQSPAGASYLHVVEIRVAASAAANDVYTTRAKWSPVEDGSAYIEYEDSGSSTGWSALEFMDAEQFVVTSELDGEVYCKKEMHQKLTSGSGTQFRSTYRSDYGFELPPPSDTLPQKCIDRFAKGGAVPGTPACNDLAVSSPAGLGDYTCTGAEGVPIVFAYCGLPEYVEPVDDNVVDCEYENPLSEPPVGVNVVLSQAGSAGSRVAGVISNFGSAASVYNLTEAHAYAEETGNTGPLMQGVLNILTPFGGVEVFQNIFDDFSDFIDGESAPSCGE